MEKHYLKNMGEITYVYGVDLEEHKKVIEKQQKRIAELEQELAKYKELQDQLGLENADEFEWFVMLDLLTDNEKNMHILDLHRELAELKEKAIVPKFKIGQEVYKVYTKDQRFPFKVKIIGFKITQTEEKNSVLYDTAEDGFDMDWCPEKILFETLEEAEKKLQELRGGE